MGSTIICLCSSCTQIPPHAKSHTPRYQATGDHLLRPCRFLLYDSAQNLLLNPAPPEELAKGHPIGVPILKVADFGFARSLPNTMKAETLCGSPYVLRFIPVVCHPKHPIRLYMAPEILRYESYDAKADLWSVGAVLYEMSVGKPPFRAQNHVELLKKIEQSKGVRFPDEELSRTSSHSTHAKPNEPPVVRPDIKDLIRTLLKRQPSERASFQEFFKSPALANCKFPRPIANSASHPSTLATVPSSQPDDDTDDLPLGYIPEHHKVIPPEVLDPKAMIPPSKFHFRRRDTNPEDNPAKSSPRYVHSMHADGVSLTLVCRQPGPRKRQGDHGCTHQTRSRARR